MKENSMKKFGIVFLFFVSILAAFMTWELDLLSTFGGICVIGLCCGTATLMWLDVIEPLERAGHKDDRRAKVKN